MHLCLKCLCAKTFCAQSFFCARDISLTVRAFWRAEQLRWVENNFEEMRKVDQPSDEMKTVELTLMTCEKRWDEMRRAEMRWEELTCFEMRWSVECEVQVWSVECEVWRVQCAESLRLALPCAPWLRAGHVLGQHLCNSFAQSTHARAWLAHGACKFYRWESSYISLRQLPPCLVRVLLVVVVVVVVECSVV